VGALRRIWPRIEPKRKIGTRDVGGGAAVARFSSPWAGVSVGLGLGRRVAEFPSFLPACWAGEAGDNCKGAGKSPQAGDRLWKTCRQKALRVRGVGSLFARRHARRFLGRGSKDDFRWRVDWQGVVISSPWFAVRSRGGRMRESNLSRRVSRIRGCAHGLVDCRGRRAAHRGRVVDCDDPELRSAP